MSNHHENPNHTIMENHNHHQELFDSAWNKSQASKIIKWLNSDQKISQIMDGARALEKELARLKSKVASAQGDDLALQAVEVKGVKVLAVALDGADAKALRETLDKLKDKLKSAAVVLASTDGGKVSLIAGVTPDLVAKVKAGELVNYVAQQVGG